MIFLGWKEGWGWGGETREEKEEERRLASFVFVSRPALTFFFSSFSRSHTQKKQYRACPTGPT
jgi:hypothetical protein